MCDAEKYGVKGGEDDLKLRGGGMFKRKEEEGGG